MAAPLPVRRHRPGRSGRPGAAGPASRHGHAVDQGGPRGRSVPPGLRADPGRVRRGGAGHAPGGHPDGRGRRDRGGARQGRRRRRGRARAARRRRAGADYGGSRHRSIEPRAGRDGGACPRLHPRRRAGWGPGGRELRPRTGAGREDPAGDRGGARAGLPAAAGGLPGAPDRRHGSPREPARDRRRVRRRHPDLPGRPPLRPARLRVAGLPRRLGTRLLLRDDLRDRDGLHGLPALLGAGALGGVG